ncbi:Uncharacterised protein [Bordetella pertussis]|nr:Uncharacterised protein [Bordetella pertussis]CFW11724.1 Uncharacterised protein [Bordetella pertussis]
MKSCATCRSVCWKRALLPSISMSVARPLNIAPSSVVPWKRAWLAVAVSVCEDRSHQALPRPYLLVCE